MDKRRSLPLVPRLTIASPCQTRWEVMEGDDRTRFCASCRLHVHNLSAMTTAEVETLVSGSASRGERLCGMLYQRADGTVLTQDCPVGWAAAKARARRRLSRIAAAFGMVATGGALAANASDGSASKLRGMRPFSYLAQWLAPAPPAPPPVTRVLLGEICPPQPPAPAGRPGGSGGAS